jgi:hypothetical protein
MRAHEAHAEGVAVSKGARVFTVFSTSKDHNQGSQAMAGCILVDFEKLQVINRSPAYKNQYVHRRDSVSLAALSEAEIEKRIRLGLVTHASPPEQHQQQMVAAEDEQWEDFEDEEVEAVVAKEASEEEYIFAEGRRSSVDLNATTENAHDSMGSTSSMDSDSAMTFGRHDGMSLIVDFERQKSSRKPRVSAIHEEAMDESMEQDEEVATVDGDTSAEVDWGATDEGNGLSSC